jgi:hypothetical protein
MARLGDTIVLCTAVGARSVKPGQDFFPLTVNYQEKAFAAGKIPGGFFKRRAVPPRTRCWSPASSTAPSARSSRRVPERGAGRRDGAVA